MAGLDRVGDTAAVVAKTGFREYTEKAPRTGAGETAPDFRKQSRLGEMAFLPLDGMDTLEQILFEVVQEFELPPAAKGTESLWKPQFATAWLLSLDEAD